MLIIPGMIISFITDTTAEESVCVALQSLLPCL